MSGTVEMPCVSCGDPVDVEACDACDGEGSGPDGDCGSCNGSGGMHDGAAVDPEEVVCDGCWRADAMHTTRDWHSI